jgi:peptidase YpeB-like protein
MTKTSKKTVLAAVLGSLLAAGMSAHRAEAQQAGYPESGMTRERDAFVRKVEAAGYTGVHDVEWEDGRWEGEARSSDGWRVDVWEDSRTGEVREQMDD